MFGEQTTHHATPPRRVATLGVVVMCALALTALALPAHGRDIGDYEVGVGDVIEVQVHGEPLGSSGQFVVAADGAVSLPCAELVDVVGQSAHAMERTVRDALMPDCYVDPQVTIRVTEFRSQPIEVLGAVSKPGVYYLDGATTLRTIITRAGGVKAERSTGQVVVQRRGADPVQVPLNQLDGVLGDFPLIHGDVISVDEGRIVFVAGEVAKPGEIAFAEGITVSEAFIKAGGRTAVARLSGSYLLRDGSKIAVNLKRVLKGKDADLLLQPGDRLVIPESPL